jgi:hypothetical protein
MRISNWFIRDYLDLVTICWFDHHELPPDSLDEYDRLVVQMRTAATAREELDLLRTCFAAVLNDATIDCSKLGNGRYPFDDQEVRAIIAHAYRVLWPHLPFPPAAESVEFYELPHEQWEALRSSGQTGMDRRM